MGPECSSPGPTGQAPSIDLNDIFYEVVEHLINKGPHSSFFRNAVSSVVVDDYRVYVPAEREMFLNKILERSAVRYYTDAATFRADLQLMYENASAYNGRSGGKHAYEPVIHWAADLLAIADKELQRMLLARQDSAKEAEKETCRSLPSSCLEPGQPDAPMARIAADATVAAVLTQAAAAASADVTAVEPTSAAPSLPGMSPAATEQQQQQDHHHYNAVSSDPTRPLTQGESAQQPNPAPHSHQHQETDDHHQEQEQQQQLSPVEKQQALAPLLPPLDSRAAPKPEQEQEQQQQRASEAGAAAAVGAGQQGSPRAAHGSSTGQQSSSPSIGSGDGSHSGLEALLAACELAAEQDSAAPRSGSGGGSAIAAACGGGSAIVAACGGGAAAPERRSYPGCSGALVVKQQPSPQLHPTGPGSGALVAAGGPGPLSAPRPPLQSPSSQQQQHQHDDRAGSSEGAGMALCCVRGGAGAEAGTSGAVVPTGSGCGAGAGGSYLASNAFKNRRHKSKQVYIKPNKVVYLPTTFVEEEFDVAALPLDCELRVEADGVQTDESFRVTIKSVPRQGLSTMYCMTNVMRFQQQYLNWQIYNWTRIDNNHIKIHLQSPSPSQTQLQQQRPDLDRATSMPEVGRGLAAGMRGSAEDVGGQPAAHPNYRGPGGGCGHGGSTSAASLKRKSDTGRYAFPSRVERRMVPEPARELPLELRLSSTGYLPYTSPIPESPPASPQRRASNCVVTVAAAAAAAAASAPLPPRAPSASQILHVASVSGTHAAASGRLHPAAPGGGVLSHAQPPPHLQFHVHQHQLGGGVAPVAAGGGGGTLQHYHQGPQQQPQQRPQQLVVQKHPGNTMGLHNPHHQQSQQQQQRGSNSSIKTEQQTCSDDSTGPVAGADAATMGTAAAAAPLLPWQHRSGGAPPPLRAGLAATPLQSLNSMEFSQQLQEVAKQLQLQAHASCRELAPLQALQLAMLVLQQDLATAPPPPHVTSRGASVPGGLPADAAAAAGALDLSDPAEQERLLLQQLAQINGSQLPQQSVALPSANYHPQQQQHKTRQMTAMRGGPRGSNSLLDLGCDRADVGQHHNRHLPMQQHQTVQYHQQQLQQLHPAYLGLHGAGMVASGGRRGGNGDGAGARPARGVIVVDGMAVEDYDDDPPVGYSDSLRSVGGRGGSDPRHRGPSYTGGASEPFAQHQLQQNPSGSHYPAEPQQQRRPSHGDRGRQPDVAPLKHSSEQQQQVHMRMSADGQGSNAAAVAGPDAAVAIGGGGCPDSAAAAAEQCGGSGSGGGSAAYGQVEDQEELHHIVCPQRSGSGHGGFIPGAGRILIDVGSLAAGGVGGRARGGGRHGPGGVADLAQAGLGPLAGFPQGMDLSACGSADVVSFMSPSKRVKIAVSADNTVIGGGGGELSMLEVLGLRAAAAAGGLPAETILAAALQQGSGGGGAFPQVAAAALGGRPFLPVGAEIIGQLL